MDNCEHLVADAADLAERLIASCPQLSLLATSRESLAVPAQEVYRLGSLGVAAEAGGLSDAARLFADRARQERPSFEVTDANRGAVSQICARLDGMPLAIELAAARAGAMEPSEIAARLDERFKLQGGGTRGRVEHHQTLRATVEWSYGLLSPAERDLFVRLSVFAGSFDLDAAVAVSAPDEEFDVLDALGSLVAKSMVAVDDHPGLGTRYRLLETLRAFGHEQLDIAGLFDTVRRAHAGHYTARAAAAARDFHGPDVRVGGRELADAAEYREATAWLMAAGQLDTVLAIGADLSLLSFWWWWWEPHDWLREALADPASAGCPHRSAALGALSNTTAFHEADPAAAERLALAAIDSRSAHPEIVEPVRVGEFTMTTVSMMRGELEAALAWAEQLIEAGRPGDDANLGWGLFYGSLALSFAGRTDEARSLIDRLEAWCRRHPWAAAGWMVNFALGLVYVQADPERSRRHFDLVLETGRALGSPMATRLATDEALWLFIAHTPLAEAAKAALEVIESMWDGRDLGVMAHHVALSVVVCARAGRYRDAAMIDGWLGQRGHALGPGDLARHQHAQADIDAHLGEDAARLRAQGAQWEPATAIEHILTTLRAISETPPPPH